MCLCLLSIGDKLVLHNLIVRLFQMVSGADDFWVNVMVRRLRSKKDLNIWIRRYICEVSDITDVAEKGLGQVYWMNNVSRPENASSLGHPQAVELV